ncbi:MAG: sugar kinase [Rhizobiales bacterium]|nr:sugar kinase [Hyphomicrobiales bacterium]MBO6697593.1 sugar kinase [Hyphomicrobiales bacterium]MBO6736152.1 sugar kinase [Hyphomicrobiales bacterium]MBO6912622.1 sugar kinase [Hyphomicrobiales bacterium]MBO6957180.1 sugar kinase [Hyphomicrobiales bacterium]
MTFQDPFASLADPGRSLRVATLGECMIELSDLGASDGRVAMGVAGDTLNFAIYLARCCRWANIEVSYLTALGDDQLSDRMIAAMREEQVASDDVVRLKGKLPGIYAIELDEAGERSFRYWRSQSAAKSMFGEEGLSNETIESFDVFALSAISLAILPKDARKRLIDVCGRMKAAGKVVVFDSNYRPALWSSEDEAREVISAMWAATSVGLPSRDDEAKLWPGETPEQLFARLNVPEVALKDGAGGPWLFTGAALPRADYPAADQVVDTTSAGDSFNAGYLSARLQGKLPEDAAMVGHRLASAVIGEKGAIIPPAAMPNLR